MLCFFLNYELQKPSCAFYPTTYNLVVLFRPAEPGRDAHLCVGCGVVEGSLQRVAQSFIEVLFPDWIQAIPAQLNGQNCEGKRCKHSLKNIALTIIVAPNNKIEFFFT